MKKRNTRKKARHPPKRHPIENLKNQDLPPEKSVPAEVLEKLPQKTQTAYVQSMSFSGPIPPPALLGQYDEVESGMANRIVTMTENEQIHRHIWEDKVLEAQKSDMRKGFLLGGIVSCLSILGACYCAYIGQPWIAGLMLAPPAGGVLIASPRIFGTSSNPDS